ncbi:M15 family metallopeptidase [Gilvimarinus chinensis]|uniref:M15 family metallopeptidase n=1 Tax=Gilvimarinus chinensis TaxID=396005 RepID=UPI000367092C|nr:M15 family metallopeptidase [Gilvimarinus chinensis]
MPSELSVTEEQALGLDDRHLVVVEGNCKIHPTALPALQSLTSICGQSGSGLGIASGYRSFERQLAIFNAKARGERKVLDDRGCAVDLKCLSVREQLFAILRFSALPGASRHHWGSDMDVFDPMAMPAGYQVQLTMAECEEGGVFGALHRLLDEHLPHSEFYRPYARDLGAIAPEPWHLSYAPLARAYEKVLTRDLLGDCLQCADLALKPVVMRHLDDIYRRFVQLESCSEK